MTSILRSLSILAVTSAALGLMPTAAAAQSLGDVLTARILPGWQEPGGTRMSGLELQLAPGWKTYWRVPGEAGIPPQFDWSGSDNLRNVQVHWPRPIVETVNGMRSIGYKETVVLPLELEAHDHAAPINVSMEVSLGVCEEVCVPITVSVSQIIRGTGQSDGRISQAMEDRPQIQATTATCDVAPIRDGMSVSATLNLPKLGANEAVVIETSDPSIWISEPVLERRGGVVTATADLVPPNARPFPLDRSDLRFTLIGQSAAYEVKGCVAR